MATKSLTKFADMTPAERFEVENREEIIRVVMMSDPMIATGLLNAGEPETFNRIFDKLLTNRH